MAHRSDLTDPSDPTDQSDLTRHIGPIGRGPAHTVRIVGRHDRCVDHKTQWQMELRGVTGFCETNRKGVSGGLRNEAKRGPGWFVTFGCQLMVVEASGRYFRSPSQRLTLRYCEEA